LVPPRFLAVCLEVLEGVMIKAYKPRTNAFDVGDLERAIKDSERL
jgi:hypothetical protein